MVKGEILKGKKKNFAENLSKTIEISNDFITNHYKQEKIIGIGQYGTVREAWSIRKPSTHVAIKILDLKGIEKTFKSICCEVSSLRQADHQNIIKIHQVFMDKKRLYLVLDYIDGVDLSDYIWESGRLSERKAKYILHQIVETINYLHSIHICHRDIKLDNIMINEDTLKITLIDFGFATKFDEKDPLKDKWGTPYFIAPEVMKGTYGKEWDMWSIGIMAYYMLSGALPFDKDKDWVLSDGGIKKIDSISYEAKDFVKNLLIKDPKKRMTAKEALNHSWLWEGEVPKTPQSEIKTDIASESCN